MLRKIKFALILTMFAGLFGCGFMSDELSGEFEGTTRVSRIYYGSEVSDTLKTGTGRISFPHSSTLRLGSNTALPDCNLSIIKRDTDYWIDTGTQFVGETNDGNGCKASLTGDKAAKVDIYHGTMTEEKDGELVVKINFQPRDVPTGTMMYQLEFRGSKKGWF